MNNSTRRQNREAFMQLFREFVSEYGDVDGKKIAKHIVDAAGGLRMDVPENSPKLNQHADVANDPLYGCGIFFRNLWISTCKEFGKESGHAIMNKIVCRFGRQRVYFPSHTDIYRWERNEIMRRQYHSGMKVPEIALRWRMSPERTQQIVTGYDD